MYEEWLENTVGSSAGDGAAWLRQCRQAGVLQALTLSAHCPGRSAMGICVAKPAYLRQAGLPGVEVSRRAVPGPMAGGVDRTLSKHRLAYRGPFARWLHLVGLGFAVVVYWDERSMRSKSYGNAQAKPAADWGP